MIGAVALVVLLVVFVPMVLDSEPKPAGKEPSAAIPPRDGAPPLPPPAPAPKVVAATPPAVAPPAAATVNPKATEPKPAEPAPVPAKAPESRVLAPRPPAKMVPPPAPPATEASAPLEGFAVQVGAFRDEDRLKQAREKLAAAGVVHYIERLSSKGGSLTRLRAGPFATRAEAEAALVKLKRSAIDGKVVPLP